MQGLRSLSTRARLAVRDIKLGAIEEDSMNMLFEDMCNGIGGDIEEEEDVILTFESEQGTAIQQQVRDAAIRAKTKEQLGKRTMTIGYHHGHLNPLPASWRYPEKMNMVQMITLYQMGSPSDGVPPLMVLAAPQVKHFDKEGAALSENEKGNEGGEAFWRAEGCVEAA